MFKKSFVYLVLSSFVLMGASFDANAKRMGGSKSVGKQSQSVTQKQQAAPAQPAQAPTAAPASAQPKKGFGMGGILGGLAVGLGLGWLLSHFGMGEAAASFLMGFLMVAAVAMIGLWLFRRFANNGQATYKASPAGGAPLENQQRFDRQEPVNFGSSSSASPPQLIIMIIIVSLISPSSASSSSPSQHHRHDHHCHDHRRRSRIYM